MRYRVQAQWKQFETLAVSPYATAVQRREMRRAFFAGVECALNRLASEMSAGDSLDDANDLRVIQEVNKELAEFAADVKAGTA